MTIDMTNDEWSTAAEKALAEADALQQRIANEIELHELRNMRRNLVLGIAGKHVRCTCANEGYPEGKHDPTCPIAPLEAEAFAIRARWERNEE